jgi:hypothetical protein
MLDPIREKLLGFLAGGVSQTAAALACGITDGYVSQILEEPEFMAALAERSVAKLETALAHDDSIETLEAASLKIIKDKLPFVRSALEATRIFKTLNEAKKRAAPATNQRPESLGAQQVTLVLPKAAAVHIQMNNQKQVIEIAGRSMATLPSSSLPGLSATRMQAIEEARTKTKTADTEAAQKLLNNVVSQPIATKLGSVVKVL